MLIFVTTEYAYTCRVTEKNDVYSFGAVLMELVTGKRPMEPEFGENHDIVYWVCNNIRSREDALELVDPTIAKHFKEDAMKVLKIATLCMHWENSSFKTLNENVGSNAGRGRSIYHNQNDCDH